MCDNLTHIHTLLSVIIPVPLRKKDDFSFDFHPFESCHEGIKPCIFGFYFEVFTLNIVCLQ